MIFITVGTTPLPFRRMADLVDRLALVRKHNETIIFQRGDTPSLISGKNIFLYRYLPFMLMQRYIKNARVVICHGGPATIYQVTATGKNPFVLPRQKRFGEHVNDHQVFYCDMLKKRGIISSVIDCAAMLRVRQRRKYSPINREPSPRLIAYLHDLTRPSFSKGNW